MNKRGYAILFGVGLLFGCVFSVLNKQSTRIGYATGYAAGVMATRAECDVTKHAVDAAVGAALADCSSRVVELADEVVLRLRVIERRHEINPHILDDLRGPLP
jgi:hypothetical protein